MIVSSIAQFNAINTTSNAAFGMMSNADALMGLGRNSGMSFQNLDNLHAIDKKLTLEMLKNKFLYMIGYAQADSFQKIKEDNIKRTFSTFA